MSQGCPVPLPRKECSGWIKTIYNEYSSIRQSIALPRSELDSECTLYVAHPQYKLQYSHSGNIFRIKICVVHVLVLWNRKLAYNSGIKNIF